MSQASYKDAAAGWDIYRAHSGQISHLELNQALRARGFHAIADRTFAHYRKLERLGYDEYVSINRLDLRHANDSVFDVADRSRYYEREYDSAATLAVPYREQVVKLDGRVTRVSEGFASFETNDVEIAEKISRAVKYKRAVLVFDRIGVERAVEVVETLGVYEGVVEVLLAFRSLMATDLLFPGHTGHSTGSRLSANLGELPSLYQVIGITHLSFDLLESMRSFADTLVLATQSRPTDVIAANRVRRMEVSNPFILDLIGSPFVWVLVPLVLGPIAKGVRQVIGVGADIQAMKIANERNQRERELHTLRVEALQLDNLKKTVNVAELVEEMEPRLRDELGGGVGELQDPTLRRLEVFKDQAIEAAAEMSLETKGDLSFEESDEE